MSTPQQHPEAAPQYPQFRFVEFNTRRQFRGAEAARIEIIYGEGDHDLIWMSAGDLHGNIRLFGEHEALTEALKAYGQGGQG
ncbi:hypothetical protein [Vreelandella alkaliphila]|uniref:Uncharacterized protein n=1 Tax=Vreelandella alkaliphila TaxID=272774 RepID=A0A7C9KVU5_9GAMM|nr:hypothetical protein [Halomonas alkaliphila]NDL70537.1 hypothetical protein [Halomonas alkaliphila]